MKKVFITEKIRESVGRCALVHDVIMENLGIEKMGVCSACGHDIKNHFGIEVPAGDNEEPTYIWVGSCCAKILCNPDKEMIVPAVGTLIDIDNKKIVVVDAEFVEKLGSYIYDTQRMVHDKYSTPWTPSLKNEYSGAWHSFNYSDFLASVLSQTISNCKKDGYYYMSEKQFAIVNKIIAQI